VQYFFEHRFCLKQHIVVPEPKGLETQGSHGIAAFVVTLGHHIFSMLAAVELNDQAYFDAGEVREIGADGVLSAKF
jgi:hypothetical protein